MSLFFSPVTLLAFVFLLGMLIFIHEFGHFFVAKLLGIHVEVFSLGFGPRLVGWRRNGTDYRVSLLPLGGYVKMLGEQPNEELRGDRGEFLSRTKWERFFVLVMGATLNIVLAVILMTGVYMHGVPVLQHRDEPAVVGYIQEGSPAARAGLRPLDTILAIGETEVSNWGDLQVAVALNPGRALPFRILREGREETVEVAIGETRREAIGQIGVAQRIDGMLVADVVAGGPASKAGLREGDLLVEAGGVKVGTNLEQTTTMLFQGDGSSILLVVERNGERVEASLAPAVLEKGRTEPGFVLRFESVFRSYPLAEAFMEGFRWNLRNAGILFETIKRLVVGQISLKALSGPIEIYRYTGHALEGGGISYLTFMAFISLQLGIVNLLPIPVLDGGHVFILAVEGILRRDLSMVVKERMMQVGLVLLLLLMGTVISLDIYKAAMN